MSAVALFVLLSAGNCKLWSELANRLHARPWSFAALHRVQWVHHAGILFGCAAAGLLTLGDWSTGWVNVVRWPLYVLWTIGYAKLIFDAGRYLFPPPVRGVTHEASEIFDVSESLGERPVGDGPASRLAGVPGNQSFRFEITRKRFALPDYPADRPLRILHLTDWHFSGTPDRRFYERVTEACLPLDYDIAVFTGDLVDRTGLLSWLDTTLARVDAAVGRYFVLGNHDWNAGLDETRDALRAAGWTDATAGVIRFEFAGGRFAITGDERPWVDTQPPSVTDAFHIALTHTPDQLSNAVDRGASLVLSGHNHGGQVVLPVLGPVYAPSRFGVRYAAGSYRVGDTLLHVGRGLGGIHPLRLRCPPEITLLTVGRQ